MPRAMTPRPGDQTAVQKQVLQKEHEQELAERARELSMASAAEQEQQRRDEVEDAFAVAASALPEIPAAEDAEERRWVVRILHEIEDMAYGREIVKEPKFNDLGEMTDFPVLGNVRLFSFSEGRRYRVPREMALHLIDKGLATRDRVAP
jgi:hypothetical protein